MEDVLLWFTFVFLAGAAGIGGGFGFGLFLTRYLEREMPKRLDSMLERVDQHERERTDTVLDRPEDFDPEADLIDVVRASLADVQDIGAPEALRQIQHGLEIYERIEAHGRTASGEPITDALIEERAARAERGYDVDETLRRRES